MSQVDKSAESEESTAEPTPEPSEKATVPRAFGLRVAYLVTSLVGLAASIELILLHIKAHTHPMERSFCSVHSKVDCLSVAESPYAVLFGVPVATWATLAFAVLVVGTGWVLLRQRKAAARGDALPGVTFALSAVSVAAAGWMAYLSHFVIGVLCIVCAVLYVVNPTLLVLSWRIAKRHGGLGAALRRDWALLTRRRFDLAGFAGGMLAIAGLLIWLYPHYWVLHEPVGPGGLSHGVTREGHRWIGARHPELILHEFTDYQCGFCRRKNAKVRALLHAPEFRNRVRVVHHHYPLDISCNKSMPRPFHPRSCELARGAMCAGEQGKFWDMSDMIFRRQPRPGGPDLIGLAGKLGLDLARFRACLDSPRTAAKLEKDLKEADALARTYTGQQIQGTPFYLFERPGEPMRPGYANARSIRAALERVQLQHGPGPLKHGRTAKGWEWIGAEKPRITFTEVSDYECFFCLRNHFRLRALLKQKEFRDTVRLVHVHYPFDASCNPAFKTRQHPRACALARAAICAGDQGRFWQMNDLIYRRFKAKRLGSLPTLAKAAGLDVAAFRRCLTAPETRKQLQRNIAYGERLGRLDGEGIDRVPALFFRLPPLRMQRAGLNLQRKDLLRAIRFKRKKGKAGQGTPRPGKPTTGK